VRAISVLALWVLFPVATLAQTPDFPKRLLAVPPIQWDVGGGTFRPAYRQGATDFANLTGGLTYGLQPLAVNALLPEPRPPAAFNTLPLATEYPEDVRFFWIRLKSGSILDAGMKACVGEASYLVFLFRSRGLFSLSYRLIPDSACPGVANAANEIMAYYVRVDPTVALALHYRNGGAEVVDVVDPGSGHLRNVRWQQRRR
jgi:hypothetical protein